MTNLSYSLVTDLLSDDVEMFHNRDIPPRNISCFYHPDANQEVRTALSRIEEKMLQELGPDNVHSETRGYLWLASAGGYISVEKLVIVLQYHGAKQRVIELNLDKTSASLHFRKD